MSSNMGFYGGPPLPENQGEDPLAHDILSPQEQFQDGVPDLIEKVIGFRSWNLMSGHMLSAGFGHWTPGENIAVCHDYRKCTNPPAPGCMCGLYAYHTVKKTKSKLFDYGDVVGAVAAWGRIRVAPTGFRAEKAEIIAISARDLSVNDVLAGEGVPINDDDDDDVIDLTQSLYHTLKPAADYYGVPIVPFDQLEEYAFNCGVGSAVPLDMYPKDKTIRRKAPKPFVPKKAKTVPGMGGGGGGASSGTPAGLHYNQSNTDPATLWKALFIVWVVIIIIVLMANGLAAGASGV